MKCNTHLNADAVGACVRCGKAVCKACAGEVEAGRLVCSLDCARRLLDRRQFVVGCLLLGFAGLLITASVFFYTHQSPFLAVVIVIYALLCLLVGAGFVSQRDMGDPIFSPYYRIHEETRWRAGIALRASHQFREKMVETLSNYSKISGENVTHSQLEWDEKQERHQVLIRLCQAAQPIPEWVAPSTESAAAILDEQIHLAHSVGWTFFAEHDARSKSFEARQKMVFELITAAHKLDDFKLNVLHRNLAEKASAKKAKS
jgi:hypothetical protein